MTTMRDLFASESYKQALHQRILENPEMFYGMVDKMSEEDIKHLLTQMDYIRKMLLEHIESPLDMIHQATYFIILFKMGLIVGNDIDINVTELPEDDE
jgi:RNA polymerase-binding transcription factor DksA